MKTAKSVYERIKKQNGETFARTIRNFDSGILEIENLPTIVRYAGQEADPLLDYLESLKQVKVVEELGYEPDLYNLLEMAGYNWVEVNSLETQNSIQHFFAPGEELCTFKDYSRFERYHILHLIKKNAHLLNRSDFKHPQREDEYATSVLSIQILKEGNFIKIMNRYNHTVSAPDNTYHSNPDNIIMGLGQALKKHFQTEFETTPVALPNEYVLINGQIFKYHTETGGVIFGENFYIKDEKPCFINKDYQLIVDNFIIDFKENRILSVAPLCPDLFPEDMLIGYIQREIENKKLTLRRKGDLALVYADDRCIIKAKKGAMLYLDLETLTLADSIFVHHNSIEEIYLRNLKKCYSSNGSCFSNCKNLSVLDLRSLENIPKNSIFNLPRLSFIRLDKVQKIEKESLNRIGKVRDLILEEVEEISSFCLYKMPRLRTLILPRVKKIGSYSLSSLCSLYVFEAPNLKVLCGSNLSRCFSIEKLELLNLKEIGPDVIVGDKKLLLFSAPNLEIVGSDSLSHNPCLISLYLPKVKKMSGGVLSSNKMIETLSFENLTEIGVASICLNESLKMVLLPKLKEMGLNSFFQNPVLKNVSLDSLRTGHCNCFLLSPEVKVYAPNWGEAKKVLKALSCKAKNHFKMHQNKAKEYE